MSGQTFNATLAGSPAAVIDKLLVNTNTLRGCHQGASSPSSPEEGLLWLDNSGSPDVLKCYMDVGAGLAWTAVGTVIGADLDLNSNELLSARLENTATDPTPGAGTVGQIILDTGDEKIIVCVSATKNETVLSTGGTGVYLVKDLPPGTWFDHLTTPPTVAQVAMTTSGNMRGKLFDATNERMSRGVRVPRGWDGTSDMLLRVLCYLNAGETDNDDINAVLDWNCVTPGDETKVGSNTRTQATKAHDIGTDNLQYTAHVFDIVIDFDDATNPILPGDLLNLDFGLSSIAEVAGIIVVDMSLLYQGNKIDEV